jgi:hypothetical protein
MAYHTNSLRKSIGGRANNIQAGANRLAGRVVSTSYLGGSAVYEIDIGKSTIVRANMLLNGPILREGEQVDLGFAPDGCVLLDAGGRRVV